MYRIDTSGAVVSLPTPAADGTHGYFSDGNASLGVKGTVVDADWLNAVQETLLDPIEEAGLTPTKGTPYDQLTDAILILSSAAAMPPIGTILAFDDFGGLLTFDTDYWAYCNGQTVTVQGIGSQTLKDLSGRYLVGYGTDGTQDLGSATYTTSPVGNAGHTVNSAHTHTMGTHKHTMGTHSHTFSSSHTHGAGSYVAEISAYYSQVGGERLIYSRVTASSWTANYGISDAESDYAYSKSGNTYGADVQGTSSSGTASGTTSSDDPGDTGYTDPGDTNSGGSTSLSIQPRSVKVRFIMRIK